MASQTFPLPVDFFAGLKVRECSFWLPSAMTISRSRGGAMSMSRRGERLWVGQMTLVPAYHAGAAAVLAQLWALREPGRSFLAHALPRIGPAADPDGSILGAATPTLHTISTDKREIRIAGLPGAYVISPGDLVSFEYGTNPVRYALHAAVTGATASGAGLTPVLEVTPPIRTGGVTGAAVQLVRPRMKAVLASDAQPTSRALITDGITLDIIQTLGT